MADGSRGCRSRPEPVELLNQPTMAGLELVEWLGGGGVGTRGTVGTDLRRKSRWAGDEGLGIGESKPRWLCRRSTMVAA